MSGERRILGLWLPALAADGALLRRPALHGRPLAVVRTAARGPTVVAVDPEAAAAGIAPGLTLAAARALLPGLAAVPAEPEADARLLERLADWSQRYTPWVAIEGGDGLTLDLTGCAHLFGGESALVADLRARLTRAGLRGRAAVAGTPALAWGLSRFGGDSAAVVPASGGRAALAVLPVAALRLEPALVAALARVGVRRVGELYPLPRAGLADRFGAAVVRRLDQALGRLDEPVSPRRPVAAHLVRLAFAEPVSQRETLERAAEQLLGRLCAGLEQAGQGVRRLELSCFRADPPGGRASEAPARCLEIGTSRPSRSLPGLLRLLVARLEQLAPGDGIEVMVLAAPVVETLAPRQIALEDRVAADEDSLADLVDRLALRLGPGAVWRPRPEQSWWPERACSAAPPLAPFAGSSWPADRPRPLRLLARPEPVEVMAPLPDDPPLMFRWQGEVHRVGKAEGPERLTPEWWRGLDEVRDYYRVEDRQGRRFWLYRAGRAQAGEPLRWFLHGFFA